MKKFIVLLVLLIPSITSASDYQDEIDQFFELYKQGKVEESVESIFKSNQFTATNSDLIGNVKNQLSSASEMVGSLKHIEKIGTYNVDDLIVHITYLVIYERQPVRFEFQFFKVDDKWRINTFSFDTGIDDDIEQLARKQALE